MMIEPSARLSRIAFYTDMTRADAAVIPLGFMLEAVVPARARWLGLIGRSSLTPLEQDAVGLQTWPALKKPFDMLLQLFEVAWQAEAGMGGRVATNGYLGSALSITTDEELTLQKVLKAESKGEWAVTRAELLSRLEGFDKDLVCPPTLLAPVVLFAPKAAVPKIGDLDSHQRQGELRAA